jgi:hypothetical protein
VQVQTGWLGGKGRSDVSRSATADLSFEEATRRADARGRWERGEPVRHASHGTLQIREKQTTRSACASRVRTRPKASRPEAVCALYGVHAPRAWSCGFSKLRDGWGRTCGACRVTSRRQRWDRRDRKALPAPKARRVSRKQVHRLMSRGASKQTASTSSPLKLAGIIPSSPSPRIQAARTALGLERPPPSP